MSARASIDLLAWESEFFGRRLGRVVFDDAAPRLTPSALTGFALVQAKVVAQATAQMDALSAIGFRPVEGEMDCCCTLPACAGGAPVAGAAALPAAEMRLAGRRIFPRCARWRRRRWCKVAFGRRGSATKSASAFTRSGWQTLYGAVLITSAWWRRGPTVFRG
ncbi:dTDP-fucosamine acetyltransferase [Sodalis praecaptivus]